MRLICDKCWINRSNGWWSSVNDSLNYQTDKQHCITWSHSQKTLFYWFIYLSETFLSLMQVLRLININETIKVMIFCMIKIKAFDIFVNNDLDLLLFCGRFTVTKQILADILITTTAAVLVCLRSAAKMWHQSDRSRRVGAENVT